MLFVKVLHYSQALQVIHGELFMEQQQALNLLTNGHSSFFMSIYVFLCAAEVTQ